MRGHRVSSLVVEEPTGAILGTIINWRGGSAQQLAWGCHQTQEHQNIIEFLVSRPLTGESIMLDVFFCLFQTPLWEPKQQLLDIRRLYRTGGQGLSSDPERSEYLENSFPGHLRQSLFVSLLDRFMGTLVETLATIKSSSAERAWGYQTLGHQNIITAFTSPLPIQCNSVP